MMTPGTYDEALQRFHQTGPEFDGWLSNHGPMVAEALARRGHEDRIHAWTDWYSQRLDDRPRGLHPIRPEAWRDPLGDPSRSGDWIDLMLAQVRDEPWRDVLARWWPRLLPGITAGATHGVIRVGHAVQALAAHETEPRRDELAHALAYWAARWQPLPPAAPAGTETPAVALASVPTVAEQEYGIRNRLAQLANTPGWTDAVTSLTPAQDALDTLDSIIDAAVHGYTRWGHGNATMLVHSATAPAAVARALPHLPATLAAPSVAAAWSATCAVIAAYRPATDQTAPATGSRTSDDLWHDALRHRGEHVIKFADTALDSAARTHTTAGLTATAHAITLDA